MYWDVGQTVAQKTLSGWGSGVVSRLSKDLRLAYPGVKGLSPSNIWRMSAYYSKYKDNPKLATLSRELSWSHNLLIFERLNTPEKMEFYLNLAKNLNLSVRKLQEKIAQNEFANFKNNQNNYLHVLPKPDNTIAFNSVKDNLNLDFLELEENHLERKLEEGIVNNIVKFLGEMDGFFTFVGRQVRAELEGEEYFIDLLFYHRILKRLVVVELKTGEFKPEYAGKMQFYLNLADNKLRVEGEKESIGIIICRTKNRTMVEYTLKDLSRPVGVTTYSYKELEQDIARYLPSEEELQQSLTSVEDEEH